MQELKLFTSKRNLQLGIATGVATFALGLFLPTIGSTATPVSGIDLQTVGVAANVGGLYLLGRAIWGLYRPRPVFHGTRDGFSVNGKKMRPWSEFRGITVHAMSYAFIGLGKFVRVKVGKSILGGHIQINPLQLSGKATDMMVEIEAYARHAKRADDLHAAMAAIPAKPPFSKVAGGDGRRHADPMPAALTAQTNLAPKKRDPRPLRTSATNADAGPVQAVPSFSERLFGRRKVI